MHIKLLLNLVFNLFLISPMMASYKIPIPEDQTPHQKTSTKSCPSILPPTIATFAILLMTQMLVYSSLNNQPTTEILSPKVPKTPEPKYEPLGSFYSPSVKTLHKYDLHSRVKTCPEKINKMPHCPPVLGQEILDAFRNRVKEEAQNVPEKVCCGTKCYLKSTAKTAKNCKIVHSLDAIDQWQQWPQWKQQPRNPQGQNRSHKMG
jgi:hypothetical protein